MACSQASADSTSTNSVRFNKSLPNRGLNSPLLGDLSEGCKSMGGHYNPDNHPHAGPQDMQRHFGDLGNIEADATGVARINIVDDHIAAGGKDAILGRGVVVHEGTDDLGRGPTGSDTKKTGNAGGRYACGVIALAKPKPVVPPQLRRGSSRKH